MADSFRRGFVPSRHLTGGGTFRTAHYKTNAELKAPLGTGDPVALSSGVLQRLTTALTSGFIGIVKTVYQDDGRPLTFNLPNRAVYVNTSASAMVEVYDDPDIVYTVECAVSLGQSNVGAMATVNVSSMNSATGISRAHVSLVENSGQALKVFRVMGLSPSELAVTANGSPTNDVEVIAARHLFRSPNAA